MSAPADSTPGRPPIWESPWYWAYVFCSAALVGVLLIGPKFSLRQAGVERKAQGRYQAALRLAGQQPTAELSKPENRRAGLWPLIMTLAAGLIVSWCIVWKQRFARRPGPPNEHSPNEHSPNEHSPNEHSLNEHSLNEHPPNVA